MPTTSKPASRTVARFILVGLANTSVGLAIIYACKLLFGLPDTSANVIGYAGGLLLSFVLNGRWTFGYQGPLWGRVLYFVLTILIAYAANLATVMVALDRLHLNSFVAQALGVPPYAALVYLGLKHVAFARTAPQAGALLDVKGTRRSWP